jgi:hypothetical protein
MAQQSLVITGARCRLYVNNKIFSITQSVSIELDQGAYSIYGINSPYPQEIATGGQNVVKGNCKGVRITNSGGLQGSNLISLFSNLAATNYCSLRLEDRQSGETIWSIPKAQVSNISESVQTKGVYSVSFSFIGQVLYWPLDLS